MLLFCLAYFHLRSPLNASFFLPNLNYKVSLIVLSTYILFSISKIYLPTGAAVFGDVVVCLFRGANGSLACFIFLGGVSAVKSTSSGAGVVGAILTVAQITQFMMQSPECISEIYQNYRHAHLTYSPLIVNSLI